MAKKKNKDKEEEVEKVEAEETVEEAEAEANVETEDATGDVTHYGVYKGPALVAVYNNVNHGDDFIKLAKARAKKIDGTAKPFVDPDEPVVDKDVVNIVNASGSVVRQYSLVAHGEDYKDLADAYLEKYGEKRGLKIAE